MDALYSPKTQTFTLIPRFSSSSSLSSSSSSSVHLSVSRIQSIRNEFLGCGYKLRLRSRRKCKRLRFHSARIPALHMVASLNSLPIVAVFVAVTMSAVAVVYSNFYFPKRKTDNDDQVSGSPSSGYNQEDIDTTKQGFHSPVNAEHLLLDNLKESNHSLQELGDSTPKDNNGRVKLSFLNSSSMHEDMPTVDCSNFNDLGVVASAISKKIEESELLNCDRETNLNPLSLDPVVETNNVLSVSLDTAPVKDKNFEESEHAHDECQPQKLHFDLLSSVPVVETGSVSVLVDATPAEKENSELLNHEHGDCQLQVTDSNLLSPVQMAEMKDAVSVLEDTAPVKDNKHETKKQEQDKCQYQESNFNLLSSTPMVEMKDAVSTTVDTASVKDKNNEESHYKHDECQLQETGLDLSSPALMVEVKDAMSVLVDSASVKDNNEEAVISEHEEHPLQATVSGERSSGLYLLYEDMSVSDYPGVLHGTSGLNSKASLLKNKNIPVITSNHIPNTLQEDQSLTSGIGGHVSVASQVGRSSHERNDLWKGKRGPRIDTRNTHPQYGHRRFPDNTDTKKIHINGKHNISGLMSSYNHLLKSGRLHECVELLEEMDRKDLLDMNKVYHTKFFDHCRRQKAVKEAFRFAKLITNPTLSTFNMLMSVCSSAQDSEGAFEVWRLAQKAGFKVDCKLYTTLISTCAKSGKVDTMFEVFHEMVNCEVEPNVHTYGALIDGCARAGQVAKAFGAYGILRSKNVKPDTVVFNALITACGQSGAVERAFDVLAEMRAEAHPIDPDHVTIGALIRACTSAGQVDRVREVYEMINKYNITGTPELYTIAINSCSQTGDWEFACTIYDDMKKKGVVPDEMFFSALIDAAGHAGNLDAAFEVLHDARAQGMNPGVISYSSLMGACSNTQNWKKALELYEDIKALRLTPTVSTMNALITALCDGDQMQTAMEVFSKMKKLGLCPNDVTYSILLAASEKSDNLEVGLMLFALAKEDGVRFSLIMCKCLTRMCSRRFEKASMLGEPVLSFKSGRPEIDSKWTSLALMIYRETIGAGLIPSTDMLSQMLRCLQLPQDVSLKKSLIENLEIHTKTSRSSNLFSLIDGFGEYDPRAFSLFEEAASIGIVPGVSFKESPIIIDARSLNIHIAEVYILTVLKGLKHRHAAGARLPSITISLPVETTEISCPKGDKTINVSGRVSQAVGALFRRLKLPYQGNESHGKIRVTGLAVKKWFQPKLVPSFSGKQAQLGLSQFRLAKGITHQQRNIRTRNLSLD